EGLGDLTLILGGVRSGKSRFAQELASELGGNDVLFVATAGAGDDEMSDRIKRHRESRPASWKTLECGRDIGECLMQSAPLPKVILVDCLTLLVSNVMCERSQTEADLESMVESEVSSLLRVATEHPTQMLIVSGEVGSGVVPDSAMGRRFRDLLGLANQRVAASSDATFLMVAGLALNAKQLATSVACAAQAVTPSEGSQG
ncbi:MAG: bifunctional adenosylcobinamide kinase/adenosylcobinamide-phosphate guanylyltransferase, partial [Planctomycetota bacterium]